MLYKLISRNFASSQQQQATDGSTHATLFINKDPLIESFDREAAFAHGHVERRVPATTISIYLDFLS